MTQVPQKSVEDLSLLVKEQVLQSRLLLLIKQILHDFKEVSGQNGQWVFVFIQELAQCIDQRVVFLRTSLLFLRLRELGASKLGSIWVVSQIGLFLIIVLDVLGWVLKLHLIIIVSLCIFALVTLSCDVFDALFEPDGRYGRFVFLVLLVLSGVSIQVQVLIQSINHLLNLILIRIRLLVTRQKREARSIWNISTAKQAI